MNKSAYLITRIAIGTSLLGHGLVRLPKLNTFSNWMTGSFKASLLPQVIVLPFSYVLPFAEFGIGLLIITGLFYRQALIAGAAVMTLLIFGSCLIENWDAIPSQLIHIAFLALLLQFLPDNTNTQHNHLSK
ncbi:DoxX family membrane protein [Pedobacter sp. L105]|uniref:DoxX family membrane protein n=1 Tax=Pedobacter sp. L105 TaxID=1641871 RepID=UPI00131D5BF7|nr:DoxX family membrane protein [Pedobacter sp. L105]